MDYALITGGSRGIGRAIAQTLARKGYYILINYKTNKEAALHTKETIEQEGGRAEMIRFDVTNSQEVRAAIAEWERNHPSEHISVLINNAGIRADSLLVFMEDTHWDEVIRTNLYSFFYVTQSVLMRMIAHRKGRIINIMSLSGLQGTIGQVNYSASKAALSGATRSLALELASKNVLVNAIAPGFITTQMTEGLNEKDIIKNIPLGRFGYAEEVAELAAFLVSDKAAYITGQVISINGGLHM